MPTGTPLVPYCRKCRKIGSGRGYDVGDPFNRAGRNVRCTGRVEGRITRSKHKGFGNGGASFYGHRGHRGEVECLDCGHRWWSTTANSRKGA